VEKEKKRLLFDAPQRLNRNNRQPRLLHGRAAHGAALSIKKKKNAGDALRFLPPSKNTANSFPGENKDAQTQSHHISTRSKVKKKQVQVLLLTTGAARTGAALTLLLQVGDKRGR